jgi:hypothetical protein
MKVHPEVYIFLLGLAGVVVCLLCVFGCPNTEQAFRQPTVVDMPLKSTPLTVIPHPKFGFDLLIIPAGTDIDGFTTMEPGLYLSGKGLQYVVEKLALAEEFTAKTND